MPEETQIKSSTDKEVPEKTPEEEMSEEETRIRTIEGVGNLFSPEAVIMLFIATLIGIADIFIPLEPLNPLDMFAAGFFGFWMWFRSGTTTIPKKPAKKISKTKVKGKITTATTRVGKWAKRLKWLKPLCFILEFIPAIGLFTFWPLIVYFELRHNTPS